MGVKDLWTILSPLSDKRPLFELEGKAVAIDMSCWVVECQNVTDNVTQPKMHLRNLFFRTSFLLLHNIFPVFVLEGEAPALKHKTIAKRNEIRNAGEEGKKKKKGGRTTFNYVLRECQEMLKYMGITCVKGKGEAEAMCAHLNATGLVAGCISQDSDCFLYGANVVYRNFRTADGGTVDEYSMEKIQKVYNLGRNQMIALALLCGCDYDEGVNGIGKELALKLFKSIDDSEILDRMKQWRTNNFKYERMEREISDPTICTECGHLGKKVSHTKKGCHDCGTSTRCGMNSSYKEKRAMISNELAIRKKALLVNDFPNQELIDEFLTQKSIDPTKLDLDWKKPMVVDFIAFMEGKVQWEADYAFKKILPLMTRWQLLSLPKLPIERRLTKSGVFVPEKIVKIRNIRCKSSFEILWSDANGVLEGLILVEPDSSKENDDEHPPDTLPSMETIEPQELVRDCYPHIVEMFEEERNAKKKKPARSRKKKTEEETGEVAQESKKPERKKRGKSKTVEVANNRKIIDFVTIENRQANLEEALGRLSITPNVTPKRRKQEIPIAGYSSAKKRGPQINKVMTTERMDEILNGSLTRIYNELTNDDFDNSKVVVDMSIVEAVCKIKTNLNVSVELERISPKILKERQVNVSPKILKELQESFFYGSNSFGDDWRSFDRQMEIDKIENMSPKRDAKPQCRRSLDKKKSVEDETDEFDLMLNNYIPLDKRLNGNKKSCFSKVRHSSLCEEDEEKRNSLGIDSLLDRSD